MLEDALTRLRRHSDPPWYVVLVINLRGHAALRQGNVPLAARLFAESINVARGLHNTRALLSAMAGLAGVALARGQAERAARLLGAVEAARASVGMRRLDNWLHAERITADTRAAVDKGVRAGVVGWSCHAGGGDVRGAGDGRRGRPRRSRLAAPHHFRS